MNTKLKASYPEKKTLLILSILTLVFGAITCVIGDIAMPIVIGILAAIYFFDRSEYKVFVILASLLLVALNIFVVLTGVTVSLFGPSSIILALMLSFAFRREENKADTAYVMTIICAAFSFISCILLAMLAQGEFTIEAVKLFYADLIDSLRVGFVESFMLIYEAAGVSSSEEIILAIFDTQLKLAISYFLIGGFITVGLGMKVFGFVISKLAEDKKEILEWRFSPNNFFAYFFVLLTFASVFLTSAEGILAISVLNLYNVFLVIFAYVGFNLATAIFMTKMRRGLSLLILVFVLISFSSFAIQVLAMLGVMFTIQNNNRNRIQNS